MAPERLAVWFARNIRPHADSGLARDIFELLLVVFAGVVSVTSLAVATDMSLWLRIATLVIFAALSTGVVKSAAIDRRARAIDRAKRQELEDQHHVEVTEKLDEMPARILALLRATNDLNAVVAAGVAPDDPKRQEAQVAFSQAWAAAAEDSSSDALRIFRPWRGISPAVLAQLSQHRDEEVP